MGGGDLNTKKSWHPSTLKNQERVWKAEQAAAEEKKRIIELQREREQEHDRSQLNEMAQRNFGTGGGEGGAHQAADNRLHWMYDKPDKQVQHEDYLLGKEIGKTEQSGSSQLNAIPAVSRRVIGSSMTKTLDDTQVDLARKMREDPLLLVKERERAARAALLNNPLQRKRLADLLRSEQEQKQSKQKKKKKSNKKDKDLDHILAAKLNALGGEKGIDLSSLLNSNDSSSEKSQSSDEKTKKKKKKKKQERSKKKSKKCKKKKSDVDSQSDSNDSYTRIKEKPSEDRYEREQSHKDYRNIDPANSVRHSERSNTSDLKKIKNRDYNVDYRTERSGYYNDNKDSSSIRNQKDNVSDRKRRSNSYDSSDGEIKYKKSKRDSERSKHDSDIRPKHRDLPDDRDRREGYKSGKQFESDQRERKQGMSEAERAAKLAEMAAAGQEREVERGRRVAKQRAEDAAAETARLPRSLNNEARALPDSLESRIKSNRHYIQRDKTHMNQHFARR